MEANKPKILLVEDDPSLSYLLKEYLAMNNFMVEAAETAQKALKLLQEHYFKLAILDVMLPDKDGFQLAKTIRNQHPDLPFLFLTARSLKVDVLKGFSVGAIDYLKKPIDEEELVVRIKNLLHRIETKPVQGGSQEQDLSLGTFQFQIKNQQLQHKKIIISLTKRESELLHFLLTHKNQLCSHKEILSHLWGKNDYFNKKSLNVFISRLRKYLELDPNIKIENVHKQGFILRVP